MSKKHLLKITITMVSLLIILSNFSNLSEVFAEELTVPAEQVPAEETQTEETVEKTEEQVTKSEQIEGSVNANQYYLDENGNVTTVDASALRSRSTSRALPATIGYGFLDFSNYSTSATITVYTDATSNTAYTYFNGGSSNYVPTMGQEGSRVKISINGYVGYINRPETASYYTLDFINENETNATYAFTEYYLVNSNRDLTYNYRYYGRNVSITIGMAPDYLSANTRYYSFGGVYFYNTRNEVFHYTNVDGNGAGAINASNPFYNYYQYLPFRSKTNLTATDFLNFMNSRGYNASNSNLAIASSVESFFTAEAKHNVNAAMELSMGMLESGYGSSSIALSKNNLFGWGAVDSGPTAGAYKFASVAEGVDYHFENALSDGYLDALTDFRYFGGNLGNKNGGLNVKYASDPFWGMKIAGLYYLVDKSVGFKDYNYYRIGIKTTNEPLPIYYNNTLQYYSKNNYSNLRVKNMPYLITSEDATTMWVESDIGICNEGDDVTGIDVSQSTGTLKRTQYSCTLNTAFAFAQFKYNQDIVAISKVGFVYTGASVARIPGQAATPSISVTNLTVPVVLKSATDYTVYSDLGVTSVRTTSSNTKVIVYGYTIKDDNYYYYVQYKNVSGTYGFGWIKNDYYTITSDKLVLIPNKLTNVRATASSSGSIIYATQQENIYTIYTKSVSGTSINGNTTWYEHLYEPTHPSAVAYVSATVSSLVTASDSLPGLLVKTENPVPVPTTEIVKLTKPVVITSTKATNVYKELGANQIATLNPAITMVVVGYAIKDNTYYYQVQYNNVSGTYGYGWINNDYYKITNDMLVLIPYKLTNVRSSASTSASIIYATQQENLYTVYKKSVSGTSVSGNATWYEHLYEPTHPSAVAYVSATVSSLVDSSSTLPGLLVETVVVPAVNVTKLSKPVVITSTNATSVYSDLGVTQVATLNKSNTMVVVGYSIKDDNYYYQVQYNNVSGNYGYGWIKNDYYTITNDKLVLIPYKDTNVRLTASTSGTIVYATQHENIYTVYKKSVSGTSISGNATWYEHLYEPTNATAVAYVSATVSSLVDSSSTLPGLLVETVVIPEPTVTKLATPVVIKATKATTIYSDYGVTQVATLSQSIKIVVVGYAVKDNNYFYQVQYNNVSGNYGYGWIKNDYYTITNDKLVLIPYKATNVRTSASTSASIVYATQHANIYTVYTKSVSGISVNGNATWFEHLYEPTHPSAVAYVSATVSNLVDSSNSLPGLLVQTLVNTDVIKLSTPVVISSSTATNVYSDLGTKQVYTLSQASKIVVVGYMIKDNNYYYQVQYNNVSGNYGYGWIKNDYYTITNDKLVLIPYKITNVRRSASTSASIIYATQHENIYTVYTRSVSGSSVNGNTIWFEHLYEPTHPTAVAYVSATVASVVSSNNSLPGLLQR